jgi:hypothetical protein
MEDGRWKMEDGKWKRRKEKKAKSAEEKRRSGGTRRSFWRKGGGVNAIGVGGAGGARRKFSTKECRDGAFNYGRRDLTSDMLMCSLTGWR